MAASTTFNDLPTEMKLFVFSFFRSAELNEKAAKVCKNWRYLCTDPYIWRKLWFCKDGNSPEEMTRVLNRNQFVRCLQFTSISTKGFNWMNNVEKHSSVQTIKFFGCSLSKSIVSRLVDIFPNVENVKIEYNSKLTPDILLQVVRWNLLKCFKLNNSSFPGLSNCIPLLAQNLTHLVKITLQVDYGLNIEAFNSLIEKRGKNLKFLSALSTTINNQTCRLIATKCINLTELRISGSASAITVQDLLILSKLPSLKILRLTLCTFCPTEFVTLFKDAQFPSLTELVINLWFEFNDKCLKTFVNCCPKLTDLHIVISQNISEKGLKSLPSLCPNLELLILDNFEWLTKVCIEEIVGHLPQMCYCMVSDCPSINDRHVCRIVDKPKSRMFRRRNRLTLF